MKLITNLFKDRVTEVIPLETKEYERIGFSLLPEIKRCTVKVEPLIFVYSKGYSFFEKRWSVKKHKVSLLIKEKCGRRHKVRWLTDIDNESKAVNRTIILAVMSLKIKKQKIPKEQWASYLNPLLKAI